MGIFKRKEELDLTGGSVGYNLFHLSLPIVVINLMRTAYNLVDTFWLGQVSKEALAAVTFAFPLVFFLISLGMGLAVAGSVLVAQYEGSGQTDMVDFAASQTVTFSFLASVLLGTVGYFFVEELVGLLGAEPAVLPLATGYMEIVSLGLFFMFGFSVFISLLRGYGDTFTPMLLMFGAVTLNMLLDPFLIFGWWIFPELGVQGAAIATVFCRGLAALIGFGILMSGWKGITVSFAQMVPDFAFFRKMVRLGLPASVEGTGRSLSINLLVAIVGTFPTAVVSGYGIGIRIFSMVFLPAMAVGRGVETMTGQNVGIEKFDRAEEVNYLAAKFMFLLQTLFGVLIFLYPEPIVAVFTDSAEVVRVGAEFLRYVALSFGFIGVLRAFTGGFRGAGKTAIAAVISIATLGLIRLPIAYVGSILQGPPGVWLAFPISNVAGAVIAFLWFRRGTWKQKVVDGKKDVVSETSEHLESVE
ncbi:MAG: MATE family efflux transporter [Candidatus Nanohaloarchaeota archaeon QJJ-7]|nr:MATE family efflux transporter [Candidatus Nanohaloarchaeota archaeon QJJ-7]